MKNQSFHPRKIKIPEDSHLGPGELKDRTVIALKRLGQQKFSAEPGGYSLDNWATGVKILLDDFEEKMGEEQLPPDYQAKRLELNELLSKPVSTDSIDWEISEVRQKLITTRGKIEDETGRMAAKLTELKNERSECAADLSREKERVSKLAEERNSESFFRRLFTRDPMSSQDSKSRVDEIEARLRGLDQAITDQKKLLKSVERRSPESPLAEDWKTLESLQTSLETLGSERLEIVQLVKAREEITASIADAISGMPS